MSTAVGGHPRGFGRTLRTDAWWIGPLLTVLGLVAFFGYATVRAFEGAWYYADPYLSPFYSPLLFVDSGVPGGAPVEHAWLGGWPTWWPEFALLPASPAIFILVFPGAFRLTCYYYRKAYYRSFAGSPPGCAVNPGHPPTRNPYRGETRLLLVQNLHRYALYFAIAFLFILAWDAGLAFFRDGRFGIGVGTLVLLLNPVLLGTYTLGCHSWRHLIAGRLDCFSCDARSKLQHGAWKKVTWLNERHMLFAWVSLFWVGFSDVYVTLVARGVITDLNTWGS
jgi:hypothetical protein